MIRLASCPITCGQPTRMTEASFRRLCLRHQEDEKSFCFTVCKGGILPAELTFIEISQEMIMATSALGICTICGQKKNVKTVRGDRCCSNCSPLYHAVHGKPELLLQLLLQVRGVDWLAEHLPKPEPTATEMPIVEGLIHSVEDIAAMREENDKLREELEKLRREIADAEKLVDEFRQNLAEAESLADMVVEGGARLVFPSAEIHSPRNPFERACDSGLQPDYDGALLEVSQSRADILLDIALGVLEGRVVGIDSTTISLLRG